MSKRKQPAHARVPFFVWRDGRPRWVPSPKLRRLGFKGRDLKDDRGQWLSKGAAIDACEALNASIAKGETPAPSSSWPTLPARFDPNDRTLGGLFDRLRASKRFQSAGPSAPEQTGARVGVEKLKLATRTRAGYLAHLRILEAWGGDKHVGELLPDDIETFYHQLAEGRGLAMANAVMRVFKLAMNFAVKKLRWLASNPVSAVDMVATEGRLVILDPKEVAALVNWAGFAGFDSIGDAVVLGALTGQRKADLLTLPEGDLGQGFYAVQQRKRGRVAYVPQTSLLVERVRTMRARKAAAWPGVVHTLELVQTKTGKPYHAGGKEFDEEFRAVRALAAGVPQAIEDIFRLVGGLAPIERNLPFETAPTLLGKHFADLRDTAVTMLFRAGCNKGEIATITGHSLGTVEAILDKHYFVRSKEMALAAGVKIDAFLKAEGVKW